MNSCFLESLLSENKTIRIRFTITKSTVSVFRYTSSIITIIEIHLMKSSVAQAHIFSE